MLVMCFSLADQLDNSAAGAAAVKEGSGAPQGSLMGFQWVPSKNVNMTELAVVSYALCYITSSSIIVGGIHWSIFS